MKRRRTRQLVATLDAVTASDDHPSADDVLRRVRLRLPRVSLGTVYRNLDKLRELGQVQVLRLADGVARYDATVEDHDHFICEPCGKLVDVEQVPRSVDFQDLQREGFLVRSLSRTFHGVCPTCMQRLQRDGSDRQEPDKEAGANPQDRSLRAVGGE